MSVYRTIGPILVFIKVSNSDLIPFLLYSIKALHVYSKNEKFRSFKSKENIHKKEVGPYRGFGY